MLSPSLVDTSDACRDRRGSDLRSAVRGVGHKAWRSGYWVWEIATHPANKGGRLAAERRAITWHWRTRSGDVDAIVTVDGKTKLRARPDQFSAVWTIYDGVHEWEELQFCLGYLRPGDHFVDIGANVGVFSALVGTRIPDVRITAMEPFPPVRADLEANLALNELDVSVVGSAVSDTEGEATFEVLDRDVLNRLTPSTSDSGPGGGGDLGPGPGGGGGTRGITVPVTTLDTLVGGDPPALVKIDVEGAELSVMRGAAQLLVQRACPPVRARRTLDSLRCHASRYACFLTEHGLHDLPAGRSIDAVAQRRSASDPQRRGHPRHLGRPGPLGSPGGAPRCRRCGSTSSLRSALTPGLRLSETAPEHAWTPGPPVWSRRREAVEPSAHARGNMPGRNLGTERRRACWPFLMSRPELGWRRRSTGASDTLPAVRVV